MIKIFCDCCGKEIPVTNPYKRVSIGRYSTGSKMHSDYKTNYLIRLKITAEIYEPDNLLDMINPEKFVGDNICDDCIIDTLRSRVI
jgi:hypothetical protein